MTTKQLLERNVRRTLVLSFFRVFMVLMPIIVLFFESRGLTLAEVLLLQAWFGVLVLILEVPSGYLADLLGRKRTLMAGVFVTAVGHSLLLFVEGFWQVAIFEGCLAIGYSLASGADLALLYDTELALSDSTHRRQKAVGQLYTAHNLSEALASVTCSVLLVWSMDVVVWGQIAFGWVAFALTFGLVEPPRQQLSRTSHAQNFGLMVARLFASGPVLRLTLLTLSIWPLTTMFAVWLLQKHWQGQGVEVVYFGYLWGLLNLASAAAGKYALQLEERYGSAAMLVIAGLGPVVGYFVLGVAGAIGGVIVSTFFFACRGLGLVILRQALNKRVHSEFRATANSFASLGFRGAFALAAPVVGSALDLWGMETTFALLGVASLVIFALLILPLLWATGRDDSATAGAAH